MDMKITTAPSFVFIQWLVFEAEGQIQIRPIQHKVATHLLDNPGAVVQLNMVGRWAVPS